MSFREEANNPRTLPGWILGELGKYYVRVLGIAQDRLLNSLYEKMQANYPSLAPSEAILGEISRDRDIPLYPEETYASKVARLIPWRSTHRRRGTSAGILRNGQPLWLPSMPTMRLVTGNSERAEWWTVYGDDEALAVDQARWDLLVSPEFPRPVAGGFSYTKRSPSNWDWHSEWFTASSIPEPVKMFRFWEIVYLPNTDAPYTPDVEELPDETIGSGLGYPVSVLHAAAVSGNATWSKKAGSSLWGVILAGDPESFDPAQDNDSVPGGYPDGTWWRTSAPDGWNRLDTAEYYYDREPYVV